MSKLKNLPPSSKIAELECVLESGLLNENEEYALRWLLESRATFLEELDALARELLACRDLIYDTAPHPKPFEALERIEKADEVLRKVKEGA